ncbi:MAG: hypothetical protein ACP6IS_01215 [Candidatus Asgardarchaeia archaeon]
MHIFVFGIFPEDSGKTLFISNFIRYLRKEFELNIAPFKPISGHNYWRQYETVKENIKKGILFGSDIYKLLKIAEIKEENIDIFNPATFLFSPVDMRYIIESGLNIENRIDETFQGNLVLAKLTRISANESISREYFFNRKLAKTLLFDEKLLENITRKGSKIKEIDDSMDAVYYIKDYGNDAIDSCYRYLKEKFSLIITESFNNAVVPWTGVLNTTLQIGIAPGYALIFDRDELLKVLKYMIETFGMQITASKILRVLRPIKVVRFPLRFSERDLNFFKIFDKYITKD